MSRPFYFHISLAASCEQLQCVLSVNKLYTGSRLPPNSMTMDDLGRPNSFLWIFLAILGCETHFKNELRRIHYK